VAEATPAATEIKLNVIGAVIKCPLSICEAFPANTFLVQLENKKTELMIEIRK
jgi:hypothetical protein